MGFRKTCLRKLLAAALLVGVLFMMGGCGGNEEEKASSSNEEKEYSGNLQVNGSTTVAPIAQAWAEEFMKKYPESKIVVTGTGSGDGIAALINGTADIAMASREMKEEEKKQFKGEKPKELFIGTDALSVIVHPKNPIKSLTLEQLKDIYTGKITNWKELGGNDAEIIVYSRDSSSGTYEFFKEFGLEGEEYTPDARRAPSNSAVVQSVAQEENAIGYIGLSFLNENVKGLALSINGKELVEPSFETAASGKYPLVRKLYMYTVGDPEGLAKAFLEFGLSKDGQEIVKKVGYIPAVE